MRRRSTTRRKLGRLDVHTAFMAGLGDRKLFGAVGGKGAYTDGGPALKVEPRAARRARRRRIRAARKANR